jgi:hypothetical protein
MTVIQRLDGLNQEHREPEKVLVEPSLVRGSRRLVGSPNGFNHQLVTMGLVSRPTVENNAARPQSCNLIASRTSDDGARCASGLAWPAAAVGSGAAGSRMRWYWRRSGG